jgi:2-keto-4-pentenoate hydratase
MMMGSIASALAEAWETGQPVAPLSAEAALTSLDAAENVAGAVLEKLALAPCGIRVTEAGLVGAMLPGRIMAQGHPLPLAVLPQGRAAPALLVVLAEAIAESDTSLPVLAQLHPALDLSASRWRDGPANMFEAAADLAGLGQVVIGKGKAPSWPKSCALGAERARRVGVAALFATAVRVAREAGGLPLGAVLVLVFDSAAEALAAPGPVTARWTGPGVVSAELR